MKSTLKKDNLLYLYKNIEYQSPRYKKENFGRTIVEITIQLTIASEQSSFIYFLYILTIRINSIKHSETIVVLYFVRLYFTYMYNVTTICDFYEMFVQTC